VDEKALKELLDRVADGAMAPDDAVDALRKLPFEDIGFAKIDHHRALRCGAPEVILCQGKTPEHVAGISERLLAVTGRLLATRADPEHHRAIASVCPEAQYHEAARCVTVRGAMPPPAGNVLVVTAGTGDLPVAEEARITAEMLGASVCLIGDAGVAGLHRLLAYAEELRQANVIVAVAGMEGALPSVVAGLVDRPVIAVPTSIGYGASFAGVTALLAMLNSCAAGVAVVNIDNGFGAGYMAALINGMAAESEATPGEVQVSDED